ncbi:hypothetical protein [Clavibacter michiganensis]|uniref:hypothetical protein n=1 Tax=Clavibacter michiganensis TaxID=28447 RepID=UPI00292F6D9F|nr:hypothetical protein [Clavibacter michiganensis]
MTDARPQPDDERRTEVLVRRSPRYFRFMGVGAVLGIIVAMVLTLTFPPNPEFSEAQVLALGREDAGSARAGRAGRLIRHPPAGRPSAGRARAAIS